MKLSIITINYNDAVGLAKTINSVIEQSWKDFEYVIIDGGSIDGSVDIIKSYQDYLTYWVSEPDQGVFNAMNKGIGHAKGDYLLILNSRDVLNGIDTLKSIFEDQYYDEDILYGDVFRESQGKIFTKSIFPDTLNFGFLRHGMISHQAAFVKRKLHDKVGLYNEYLKFSADWYFFIMAICKYNSSYRHIKEIIAVCNTDGLTCNPQNFKAMREENQRILNQEFGAFLPDYNKLDKLEKKGLNNIIKKMKNMIVSKFKVLEVMYNIFSYNDIDIK
ncbi:MAG: glycosyltransferase family 2 protein [Paludibacter sp.]|nr:glycosyltransferase family 2 protein [Paludibacter sp.]